jgi:DnaJ-class molecular chaperone
MAQPCDTCITCHGTGEIAVDGPPETCPDCFGEGRALSRGTKVEWRLRALERTYAQGERETAADVQWLIDEVRTARGALVHILARSQDADEGDGLAREVRYAANEALGLYTKTTAKEGG